MHILGLIAENYKRLRVVQITPKGRVVQITGKNGQGKSSVLDAIWSALVGAKATPEKPVRRGAEKARIKLNLGDLVVTRTISPTGNHVLTVENAKGVKITSPQKMLDDLLGELSFDPLAFVSMKPKEQVETLRKVAKIDLDVEALNASNQADFDERTIVNREVKRLETEVASITLQDGLPRQKLDEAAVLAKIAEANEANKNASALMRAKNELGGQVGIAKNQADENTRFIESQQAKIAELEVQLDHAKKALVAARNAGTQLEQAQRVAQEAYDAAPAGEMADMVALTNELQQVQITNREIDKRTRRFTLEQELGKQQKKAAELTRSIEKRNEEKTTAIQTAKMPVDGLSFDENQVQFNGIPLEQLGEAEQIRIARRLQWP